MILVTGCAGFIGRTFCSKLDSENLYRVDIDGAFAFLEKYKDLFLLKKSIIATK